MAVTPSAMRPLGSALPEFSLPDVVSGKTISSAGLAGRPLVVAFICNHCPFVIHLKQALVEFGKFCAAREVFMVAISSNSVLSHPQDGPERMAEDARLVGYPFPYLFDQSQSVARAFDARCTPDFFLFDANGTLVYRGQFDETRPGRGTPHGSDLKAAVQAVCEGLPPISEQIPSIGCNIKWDPGNAPE
jgi:peroxiredoxin